MSFFSIAGKESYGHYIFTAVPEKRAVTGQQPRAKKNRLDVVDAE